MRFVFDKWRHMKKKNGIKIYLNKKLKILIYLFYWWRNRSLDDIENALINGADKICLNSKRY